MKETYFENETFRGIQLEEERLEGYHFVDCTFEDCSLKGCTLYQCMFNGCTFSGCTISDIQTKYGCIKFGVFSDCDLHGIHWNDWMTSGGFGEPISKMVACRLRYNTFAEMNFRKFQFTDMTLLGCTFSQCDLRESSFRRSKVERTEFIHCDLRKGDFRDAVGYQVDILTCQVKGARFTLPEAMNLLNGLEIKIET